MNRAEMTRDLLESVYGDLPEMPLHEPVIRPDLRPCGGYACRQGRGEPCRNGCQSVPLKTPRIQVDREAQIGDWRRRADLPVMTDRVELANGQTRSAADTWHRRDVQQAAKLVRRKRSLPWVAAVVLVAIVGAFVHVGARAADSTDTAALSAAADGASTVIAVGSGAATETGLITSPPVFAAVAITKVAVPYMTKGLPAEQRKPILQASSGIFGGAAANNMTVFVLVKAGIAVTGAVAALPVAIGLGVGYYLYTSTGEKFDREQHPITAPEPDAQLALAEVAR